MKSVAFVTTVPDEAVTESIFRSFMNNSQSPAWIVDEDGIIIFMNDLFKEVWKLDDSHLHTNVYDHLPAALAEQYRLNNARVIASGLPVINIENACRADGSPGIYLVYKFPLQTVYSKPLVGGQSIDITDERKAQEEIAKSNERFFYAAQATSDSIWDWDIEGGHIYRSESFSRLTGYDQTNIESNLFWWYERIHPEDRERVIRQINNCMTTYNSNYQDEYRFLCADGSYKYFSDKGHVIYKKGQAVRAIGALQDLTEKRTLEAELAQQKEQERIQINQAIITAQDHERNELSKELHDNVNQILSSAAILISAIKGDDGDPLLEKTEQYIDQAIQELRRLSRSLNSSVITEVGLQEPVEEIVENIRLSQQMDVTFEYDPSLEDEIAPELQLMLFRVIQEQTNNVVKHAGATRMRISVVKNDEVILLLIEDNGKGFEISKKTKGIGLINIRNRVEVVGGTLSIETQPGEGCRMAIAIPI